MRYTTESAKSNKVESRIISAIVYGRGIHFTDNLRKFLKPVVDKSRISNCLIIVDDVKDINKRIRGVMR